MLSFDKDGLFIKVLTFFCGLGFVISLIFSLIGGAGFPAILYQPLISALVMAAVTFAGFFIIKKYVPGLTNIDLTENVENNLNENLSNSEDMGQDEFSQEEQLYDEMGNGEFESSADNVSIKTKGNQPAVKNEQKRAAGEGEIMVEGVPIKNEPKLMAEAIQHLMSKDE